MAWTTPGTATAGSVLTASFWNTNVRDNTQHLYDVTPQVISTQTLASAGLITFSSIPQTYRHLELILRLRVSRAVAIAGIYFRLNDDSGANYQHSYVQNVNTTLSGNVGVTGTAGVIGLGSGSSSTSGVFGVTRATFMNYSQTGMKQFVMQSSAVHPTAAGSYVIQGGGYWSQTGAITKIVIGDEASLGNIAADSSATLIGIPA